MTLCRLADEDSSAFCHKISAGAGCGPACAFDGVGAVMRSGQAVTKDVAGAYSPDMKLGEQ